MIIYILYLLDCFLITRIFFQWSDKRVNNFKNNIFMILMELILLVPTFSSFNLFKIILLMIIFYHIILFFTEKKMKNIFFARIIQVCFLLITSSFLLGITRNAIKFNPFFIKLFNALLENNALTRNLSLIELKHLVIYIFGLLITLIELNHIIRAILKKIKSTPILKNIKKSDATDADADADDMVELNRGKIIGAIERVLFFFFVLTNNYTSIGFILAAKGITRFKKLDDKDFAEYVLIGTLLSSSLSIFWAELIKHIINTI